MLVLCKNTTTDGTCFETHVEMCSDSLSKLVSWANDQREPGEPLCILDDAMQAKLYNYGTPHWHIEEVEEID